MITVKVKEDRTVVDYDYVISSLADLDELMKVIYKPIIGTYHIGLTLSNLRDVKYVLSNQSRYNHIDIHLTLTEAMFKQVSLALPNVTLSSKASLWDYMMEGIASRRLLIAKDVVSLIYSSAGKSYDEIDDALDTLKDAFGAYMQISKQDVAKHLVLNTIVYPRTVLVSYINLYRWRASTLQKCLNDISPEIVLAAMVKQVKKIHEQKAKYLSTGLGSEFIRKLNTRNLNLMYYTLTVNKPYHLNDITLLLEVYERGLNIR